MKPSADDPPEKAKPKCDTDSEGLALLADLDAEDAEGLSAYAHARSRARAVERANEYLRVDDSPLVAHEESALFNPVQRLWIVADRDPAESDVMLMGGLLVVPENGSVYRIGSPSRGRRR